MRYQGWSSTLVEPRRVEFERVVLDSDALGQNEILAATEYSAISPGTELAAYRGLPPLRPTAQPYPRLVGYLNAAKVLHTGGLVRNVAVGDRILTYASHRSHFIMSDDRVAARLPQSISSRDATITYLFYLGWNALMRANFRPGQRVAVVGLGAIGLCVVSVARAFGATVSAISGRESALSLAQQLGAGSVFRRNGEDLFKAANQRDGLGVDIVVTTSNDWDDWLLALKLPRFNGVISVVGFPGREFGKPDFNPLDSAWLYDKQLSVVSSGLASRETGMDDARDERVVQRTLSLLLQLVQEGRLSPAPLISIEFPGRELQQAYETLLAPDGFRVTAALRWE
jgi:threonine dehydrogenase-like Zn-dependent dehydrogenase